MSINSFKRKVASNEVNLEVLENGSVSDGTTDSFFNDVFEVRKLMEDLSNNIQSLNGKQSDVLAKPTVDDAQKVFDFYFLPNWCTFLFAISNWYIKKC